MDHSTTPMSQQDPKPIHKFTVTKNNASELIENMMELGYFTEDNLNFSSSSASLCEPSCVRTFENCMTQSYLASTISNELLQGDGRISLDTHARNFGLFLEDVNHSVTERIEIKKLRSNFRVKPHANEIYRIGNELITSKYLDVQCREVVNDKLRHDGGIVLVSDVATDLWHLPLDFSTDAISQRLTYSNQACEGDLVEVKPIFPNDTKLVTGKNGLYITTSDYENRVLIQIENTCKNAEESLLVRDIAAGFELDPAIILHHVKNLCENGGCLDGQFHGSNIDNALYIPTKYLEKQENIVEEYFSSYGYVSIKQCNKTGIPANHLVRCVLESFPIAIRTKHFFIHPDIIIASLQAAIEECICTNSFLDLSLYLPQKLLSSPEDIRLIVEKHILHSSSKGNCLVSDEDLAFFFSSGLVEDIKRKVVGPVINEFSSKLAAQIVNERSTNKMVYESKGDSKEKHLAVKIDRHDSSLISFDYFVKRIIECYPDLSRTHDTPNQQLEVCATTIDDKGPVYSLCRIVFPNDELNRICRQAIDVELKKLTSAGEVALNCGNVQERTIEESFEDRICFPTACYVVHMHIKFLKFVINHHDEFSRKAEQEFLESCAADFTRRITEFCFFKHKVDSNKFYFESNEGKLETNGGFYAPVNTTAKMYPEIRLCCAVDLEECDTLKKLLSDSLPGNIGDDLGALWSLCGYGHQFHRGNFELFLSSVGESCLSICGAPFKALDKKSEKQLLLARKNEMLLQLEKTTDEKEILELVIMLLYQQIRGFFVNGKELNGYILTMLRKENKIPSSVGEKLLMASLFLKNGQQMPKELVLDLRSFGLSKNISKI